MNESMPVKAILLYEVISGATSKQQLNYKKKIFNKDIKACCGTVYMSAIQPFVKTLKDRQRRIRL